MLLEVIKEPGLFDQFVEKPLRFHESGGRVEFGYLPSIEHHDFIGVEDRIDAMRYRDYGAVAKDGGTKGRLKEGIGLDVDCSLKEKEVSALPWLEWLAKLVRRKFQRRQVLRDGEHRAISSTPKQGKVKWLSTFE